MYVESMDKEVSFEEIFKGDGKEMGYLLTKYVGKDRYEIRKSIMKKQGMNACLCWKFLTIR